MKKDNNSSIALVDNNILDKSIYINDEKFWQIEEVPVVFKNKTTKLIKATKTFINSQNIQAAQIIEAQDRLPDHKDNAVLFALITLAQEQNSYTVETTYYKIIEHLKWSSGAKIYKLVRDSLKVWHNLKITYENCFYTHESGHINFSSYVITSIEEHEKEGRLIVQFEPRFFNILVKNRFFTGIYLENYAKLSSGFQRRLYEILSKSFNNNLTFEIRWDNLKIKTEDSSKYRSDFIKKVHRAVNAINNKTDLKLKLEVYGDILLFRLQSKEKAKLFSLLWYLETYKSKIGIDEDFILLFKNKCFLKYNEKTNNYYVVCRDSTISETVNNNPYLKKALIQNGIDFVI